MVFNPARLQEELDKRLLSQAEAARMLDLPHRNIQRWLAGHAQPRRAAVRRMAHVFEVEHSSFYIESDEMAA